MDLISSSMSAFFPFVIANTIDGLIEKDFKWFYWLIVLEVIYLFVNTFNKLLDTRIYTKILEDEKDDYYKKAVADRVDDTIIAARVNMIDDFTEFLEIELPNIFTTILNILIAFWYLSTQTTPLATILASIEIATFFIIIFIFQKKIKNNIVGRKNEGEKEQSVLLKRRRKEYRKYLKRIFKIDINASDIEAIIYFVINLIHIVFLVLVILWQGNIAAGVIYATITYIYNLNSEILDLPNHYIAIKNLIDTAERISED